jgi:hypothetical protein
MLFGKRSKILHLRHRSSTDYLHLTPGQVNTGGAQSARLHRQLDGNYEHPYPTDSKRRGKLTDLRTSYFTALMFLKKTAILTYTEMLACSQPFLPRRDLPHEVCG